MSESAAARLSEAKVGDVVILQTQNLKTPGSKASRIKVKVLKVTDFALTTTHGRFRRDNGYSVVTKSDGFKLVDPGGSIPPPSPPKEDGKAKAANPLDKFKILVIGDRVWGKGLSLDEALQKASRPKAWQAFLCHADTTVDGTGRVEFPKSYFPREIARRAVRPGKEFIVFGGGDG